MRARLFIGITGIGGVAIVLAAICVVFAQHPQRQRSSATASPAIYGSETRTIVPPSTFPGATVVAGPTPASAPTKAAVIELRSGLRLEGQLRSVPISFHAIFGPAALPLETIRGIRMSDKMTTDEGGTSRPAVATIILSNGDSLTGTAQVEALHLHTEWGEAIVKLAQIKSLLLTDEGVTWEEMDGRWRLVPAADTAKESEPAADSAGTTEGYQFQRVEPSAPVPPPATQSNLPAESPPL